MDPANVKLGLAMYGAYFVLFTMLFWDKSRKPLKRPSVAAQKHGRRQPAHPEPGPCGAPMMMICGVPLTKDGAGFPDGNESPEKQDNSPARGAENEASANAEKLL